MSSPDRRIWTPPEGAAPVGAPRPAHLQGVFRGEAQTYSRRLRVVAPGLVMDLDEGTTVLTVPLPPEFHDVDVGGLGTTEHHVVAGVGVADGRAYRLAGRLPGYMVDQATAVRVVNELNSRRPMPDADLWAALRELTAGELATFAGGEGVRDLLAGSLVKLVTARLEALRPLARGEWLHGAAESGVLRRFTVRSLAGGAEAFLEALRLELEELPPAKWPELLGELIA